MEVMSTPDPADESTALPPAAPVVVPPAASARSVEDQYGERAYEFAKWAILNAVYPTGTLVGEAELAHEMGLTRAPVRRRSCASRWRAWSPASRAAASG